MLKRDYRTVKKAAMIRFLTNKNETKGKNLKNISDRDVRQLSTTIINNPLLTNGEVFTIAGIANIKRD